MCQIHYADFDVERLSQGLLENKFVMALVPEKEEVNATRRAILFSGSIIKRKKRKCMNPTIKRPVTFI